MFRTRRATRIAVIAMVVLLMVAIGVYLANNRVREVIPTQEARLEAPIEAATSPRIEGRDGSWITISGRVISPLPNQFALDYGSGVVTVEMDDRSPLYQEAQMLRRGDRVVVTGRIDDNLYRDRTIEARSVFVPKINKRFFASAEDEENLAALGEARATPEHYVDLVGTVTAREADRLVMAAGGQALHVDLSGLPRQPRSTSIAPGDRIYVWGDLEIGRAGPKLLAKGINEIAE